MAIFCITAEVACSKEAELANLETGWLVASARLPGCPVARLPGCPERCPVPGDVPGEVPGCPGQVRLKEPRAQERKKLREHGILVSSTIMQSTTNGAETTHVEVLFIHFNSFTSSHVFQFVHVKSFISIHSCQFINFNS